MSIIRNTAITFQDSFAIDAFGRLRVSEPTSMLDLKLNSGINPLQWIQYTALSGSISPALSCAANITSAGTLSSTAIMQSKRRAIYQPGKSLLALLTFNFNVSGNGTPSIRKRVGFFDENDGVFLEQNGIDVRWVLRTNTGGSPNDINAVTKANWNIDKFDGTGPSGIVLDFSKTQIHFVDLEWLGVGRVRTGFVVNGLVYYAHQFLNTNVLTVPYMSNPNLPCRYECTTMGTTVSSSMLAICSTVMSEGGFDKLGRIGTAGTSVASRSLGTGLNELVAIRISSASIRNTIAIPFFTSTLQATKAYQWSLILNPQGLTGTGWAPLSGGSSSSLEYTVSRTGTISAGYVVASGYVSAAFDSSALSLDSVLGIGQYDLTPSSDILSLAVYTLDGSANAYYGSIGWRELS